MLKKFEVENFKGFEKNIVLDLSAREYEFNKNIVVNDVVNKAIIYGKNGVGKSSLGIAIFKDKSWVTDKGTYYASSGEFRGEDVSLEYIEMINNIVSNRTAISKMIVLNDYYKQLFSK